MFTIIPNQLCSAVSTLQVAANPGDLLCLGVFVLFCFHSKADTQKIARFSIFLNEPCPWTLEIPFYFILLPLRVPVPSFPKMSLNQPIYMCEEGL